MLTILFILSGILTFVMAVYGGLLTSDNKRHQWWFKFLGVVGVVLIIGQAYFLRLDDRQKSGAINGLQESIKNLQTQTITLLNAIRLQASLEDLKHLEGIIVGGFTQLEAELKGQRPPKQPEHPILTPPIIEHVRMIQRRAASTDPNAPYGLQVLLQTDVKIEPVAFRIDFDNEISDGNAFIVGEGAYTMMATAYSSDHKSFMFSFHSPAFTPNSSLIVSVQSKYDVRATKIEKIQPLF